MLNRIVFLVLCVSLLGLDYYLHTNMKMSTSLHDTYYQIPGERLREIQRGLLFAVLGWCALFLRREPLFARVGIVAVIAAFALMWLPPKTVEHISIPPSWH